MRQPLTRTERRALQHLHLLEHPIEPLRFALHDNPISRRQVTCELLSFCLAFHPSSLPLPLFGLHFSLHAFLATALDHSLAPRHSLSSAHRSLSFFSEYQPSSANRTTAHRLCNPLVSSLTLSLYSPTARLRRLAPDACGLSTLPDHNSSVHSDA